MSFTVQSKLLRVLQGGKFNRVGGSATLQSGARVIALAEVDRLIWARKGEGVVVR